VFSTYLLSRAVALPVFGKLADLFPNRTLYLTSIIIFLVGSILAGMAQSMTALTVFRAIQGIGAGGNFALVYIVLADLSEPQDRGRLMSYASFVWGLASVLGPSLGGFIVGATFAAVGAYLVVEEGQRVFGSIFGGIGALVALATVYAMFNSLEVARDASGFRTVRRWLGIPVKRSHMGSHEFARFSRKSSFQTQGGGKHIMHYTIYAEDRNGRKLVVGEGFKGESQADAATEFIARELGLARLD
jgi:MFS family permease